jgi:sulfatase maturation enzyme AslB (radical SAM superfamily)
VVVTAFPVAEEDNFVSTFSIPPDEVDDFVSDVQKEKTNNPFMGLSEKVIEFLPKFLKGEMPHICDAGRLYMGVSTIGDLRICPIGPNSPDWKVGSLVTSSVRELLETNRFKQVLEARKNCAPCFAGCTTPYSLLFRGSMKDLTKEAFAYYRIIRRKDRNQSEHFFDVYSD